MNKTIIFLMLTAMLTASFAQPTTSEQSTNTFRERLRARQHNHAPRNGQEADRPHPMDATTRDSARPDFADVAYGGDPLQRFDVYLPEVAGRNGHAPVLVMVHGGGWKRGDKKVGAALQNKVPYYTRKGMVLISVNYRLVPQANPVEQAQDIAKALTYIQSNARAWGVDPARVVLMGHSAGAHLVTLVTADAREDLATQAQPWLGTVSLDGAGVDVEQSMKDGVSLKVLDDIYDNAFGTDPALWKAASPMAQLSAGARPMLMVCSITRPDKPCKQTQAFVDKATKMGVKAKIYPVKMSHGDINSSVGGNNELTAEIDKFLASVGIN